MKSRLALLLTFIIAPVAIAFAGSEITDSKSSAPGPTPAPGCVAPKEWEFRIGFPGWIPLIEGDYGAGRVIAPVHVSFHDVLDKLIGIADTAMGEARRSGGNQARYIECAAPTLDDRGSDIDDTW